MKRTELKRTAPLARRSGLARKGKSLTKDELVEKIAFNLAVIGKACVVRGCERRIGPAHHVVYEQHCPKGRKYDRTNAMPVCPFHHRKHHDAVVRLPLSALTDENRAFAEEVLGEAADHYLRRRYADA